MSGGVTIDESELGAAEAAPGAPVFSAKYRSVLGTTTGLTLTATFQTLETVTGSGKFIGFSLDFGNGTVEVLFTIDTNQIFSITNSDIIDLQSGIPQDSGPASQNTAGGPMWEHNKSIMSFFPPFSIEFTTEFKVEAKKIGGPNVTYNKGLFTYTKET